MKLSKNNILIIIWVLIFLAAKQGLSQALNSNDSQTLRSLAETFERAGQTKNAADYYVRASLANPKDIGAYLGAKRTLDEMQAYDRFAELVRALEQKRRDVRYRVDLVWVQYKQGDEAGARKEWNRILADNPGTQQAFALVGEAYVENQLYEDAIATYLSARKNFKDGTLFMFELSHVYLIMNKQEKLVDEYVSYLKIYPQQISFLSAELQQFMQNLDDIDPLMKQLKNVLKTPDNIQIDWAIHLFLADCYTMKQDYGNALAHFVELERRLDKMDSASSIGPYEKGRYLYEFANTTLAADSPEYSEQAFTVIINEFADSKYAAAAKLGLANVYTQQQNFEKAIAALQAFVELNKKSNETRRALLQIGDIAFDNLFDIERAEKAYHQALKEYHEVHFQVETLFRLADCAVARNDLNAAEVYLQNALEKSAREIDLRAASLLQLAQLEFYRMSPKHSLRYLDEFADMSVSIKQPNLLENDALELSMILQENINDSTSLAMLGQAKHLAKQRKYEEAKLLLEHYLLTNPNSPLRSELRLHLADVYRKLKEFEPAVFTLDNVYADSESFYRDVALLSSAEICEKDMANLALAQQKYEKLLVEFPGSIYLEKAREQVRKIEEIKKP